MDMAVTDPTSVPPSQYLVGDKAFEMVCEARCRTCCHPQRADIDVWLLEGISPSTIVERVGSEAPTASSVARHRDRHLPVELVAREALLQERSAEDGVRLDDQVRDLVDARKLARLLAEQGARAVLEGRIVPQSFADVVRVTDLLVRTEQLAGDPDQTELQASRLALMRFIRAVQEVASPETWREIGERVQDDEALRAIELHEKGRETDDSRAVLQRELPDVARRYADADHER
jgi:hypothetical protein